MSDETPVEQPGGRMTRDDLVRRLTHVAGELHDCPMCEPHAETVEAAAAALAAPPDAPLADAAAVQEIMLLLTPLVADAAIVGRTYGWPDVLAVVRAAADKLKSAPSADLVALVREWQAARKPTVLATPGEFLAETFQAAVRRMSAADEALAACRLDVAAAETPAAVKRVQTPKEAEMLRALSDALTGGALGRIREGANSDTGRSDAVAGTNASAIVIAKVTEPSVTPGRQAQPTCSSRPRLSAGGKSPA